MPAERRIEFRDRHASRATSWKRATATLWGDGVNIAARLESVCEPGGVCLSEQAYWQVKGRLDLAAVDFGPTQLKNIAEPMRVYSLRLGVPAQAKPRNRRSRGNACAVEKAALALMPLAAALTALVVLIGCWRVVVPRCEPACGCGLKALAEAARPSPPIVRVASSQTSPTILPKTTSPDGVTENLTTELSRLHKQASSSHRNTAFTFKGKTSTPKPSCKALGVRYVLRRLGAARRNPRAGQRSSSLTRESGARPLGGSIRGRRRGSVQAPRRSGRACLARTLQVELLNTEAQRSLH